MSEEKWSGLVFRSGRPNPSESEEKHSFAGIPKQGCLGSILWRGRRPTPYFVLDLKCFLGRGVAINRARSG